MGGFVKGFTDVSLNLKPLQEFYAASLRDIPNSYGKVGIIGKKASEVHEGGMTNVSIGVTHEFGSLSKNIPRRSFIKDTLLIVKKKALIADFENILQQVIKQSFNKGQAISFKQAYARAIRLITLKAESYVIEAFETQGFGRWKPLSPQTIQARARKQYRGQLLRAQASVASAKRSIGANTCIRRQIALQKSLNKANNRLNKVKDKMQNIQANPLVDTGELKRSIGSVVISKK